MSSLADDLSGWMKGAGARLDGAIDGSTFEHVGSVLHIGDGVASVTGLPGTQLDELLRFETGVFGLAIKVEEKTAHCVLLGSSDGVTAGSQAWSTGEIVRTGVGDELLGRVVDALGRPLDGGDPIDPERYDPIERPAPGIVDRALITQPLMTGITAVDGMIPLGRGQRELIIGDRKTGKTAIAVDAMINQKDTDVICVYVAIGQKASTVRRVVDAVREHGAIERCIFVVEGADASPGAQWIAPYAGCTMAEYYRDKGRHALLIVDDLTKHAIIYRQLSLLLRQPPGREAFPGDVFYVHSRLLERAAKLSDENGGGSLTALPIAETQAGNLSAYIPTNLISITDGQIYLDPKLFYEGQKPAINIGLSVSRVGGKTQAPVLKRLSGSLKLDYAQFLELEIFTRFGAMVDDRASAAINHGKRIRAILSQNQYAPVSLAVQSALLLAVKERLLDALDLKTVEAFKTRLADWLEEQCPAALGRVRESGQLNEEDEANFRRALKLLADRLSSDAPDAG